MKNWIEKHLAWRSSQGHKKATLEAVSHCLTAFESYCRDRDLHDQVLNDYQQHLLWTPVSNGRLPAPATVDQHLRLVRAFLRHLFRDGVLEMDLTADLVLPRPRSRAHLLLTRDQLEQVFARPDLSLPQGLRDLALLRLAAELGFSAQRCRELDAGELDRGRSQLRGAALSPHLAEYLLRYLDRGRPALLSEPTEPALFLTLQGRRMSAIAVTARIYEHTHRRASPRALHRAWRTHRETALRRRLPEL